MKLESFQEPDHLDLFSFFLDTKTLLERVDKNFEDATELVSNILYLTVLR